MTASHPRILNVLMVTGVLLLASGCAQHTVAPGQVDTDQETHMPPHGRQAFDVSEAVTFSPDAWPQTLKADLYKPDANTDPRPAVLMVHGGGWEGRSRDDMRSMARHYARAGFLVMNVDYRFTPEYQFPAQLHDVQIAMHWLHDNAERLSIDPDRIAAVGFSSGAHLVSLMAMVAGQGSDIDRPYGGTQTRPFAVVSGGTPSDLRKFDNGRLVEQFLGGTRAEEPDAYALASPVVHVHDQAPPVFLFHGTWDGLVPPDQGADYYAALSAEGVHAKLFRQRLRGHVTSLLFSGDASRAGVRFLYSRMPESADLTHTE